MLESKQEFIQQTGRRGLQTIGKCKGKRRSVKISLHLASIQTQTIGMIALNRFGKS